MLDALLQSDPSLAERAQRIAARLTPGRVVVSCKLADAFMPSLFGSWLAGATVDLLPNVQPATLDRVDADADVLWVLHDSAELAGRSAKALYVPELLAQLGAAPSRPLPEIAVRMSTSGTTERPKYITKTLDQLLGELDVLARVIEPAQCVMSTVPLSHLYGLLFGALLPLRFGARIVSHNALLPADVAAVIERENVELMISTPAHMRAMVDAPMPRGLRVISSGAPLPAELHVELVRRHGWHITEVFGSTETGGIATRTAPGQPWTALPSVGVSAPNEQLVVEAPWCERVVLDDRVKLLSQNTFEHLGRSHELIKIGGKRADARAIEAAVLAIPGVTDVALHMHAASGREPRVALAVVGTATREAITDAVRAQFDPVFVPRIIKLVPEIPRTDRGKRDTGALTQLFGSTDQIPVQRIGPGHYSARIPRELIFFRGHFDGFAILPGAVLIERVVWPLAKEELPVTTALRGIRRLRFQKPIVPDQELAVTLKHAPGRVLFEVSSSEQPVASGQLLVE